MSVELKLDVFGYLHFTLEIIHNTDKRLEKKIQNGLLQNPTLQWDKGTDVYWL